MNIVIPMAGAGSRFLDAGFTTPKPLIKINEIEMIELVVNNIKPASIHKFIFICQQVHIEKYNLKNKLSLLAPGCEVIGLDEKTEGAACTVLAARNFIDNNQQLMIANSDQYIDFNINDYIKTINNSNNADGFIMTMTATDPKWSFVVLNRDKFVTEVVEKKVVSNEATVGIYNFKYGHDFVSAADAMIKDNIRVNNEFYVAPVYNKLISNGKLIKTLNIGSEAHGMYGLGTPKDLELFLSLPIHIKATNI